MFGQPESDCSFRTGYITMKESNRELLGDNVVSQIDEAYGIDEEGELDGSYWPCGHPRVRMRHIIVEA